MRIAPEHIQEKAIAGQTKAGAPILYILTKGGLHAFFIKSGDGIESIGAAPHRAIAEWIAEKKQPGLEWSKEFMAKAERSLGDLLAKSEQSKFDRARALIFAQVPPAPIEDHEGLFFVYDAKASTIEVMDELSLRREFRKHEWSFVRPVNLSEPPDFVHYRMGDGR